MKLTANILAIYLLLGSFIPRTDFSQLLRLKDLQEHYQLHCAEAASAGQEVCLQNFLYEHFVVHNSHAHEEDGCSHEGLPMHSCSCSLLMAFATVDFEPIQAEPVFHTSSPTSENSLYSFLSLYSLDRPPC